LQPFHRFHQRGKTIDPPALGIQIHEFRRLAGVLAHALQVPMIDNVRNEAFLVLQFHRIEDAAVRVDADEKLVLGSEIEHGFSVFGDKRSLDFTIQKSAGQSDGGDIPSKALIILVPTQDMGTRG
jgi:hypothetical protein